MTILESMQAKIKKLEQQAEALIAKQSSGVIEKIRKLMAEHGLTAADIDGHAGGKVRAKKVGAKAVGKGGTAAVKYRDPKSGATWTGHGRAPQWIASEKNRGKFLVDGGKAMPAPVSKAKAAGNYVRGPQPALYRDPKSGATWSGRGRAPTWIAKAKDRSKFLIAGGAELTVAATASAVSKAKAVGRKMASKSGGATAGKGQPKGPQPAKYRDPKSGATWSGRGSAPAWLAGAKDRSKFLIDGVSGVADSAAASKPKAVAKKPATTTAVAKKAPVKKLVGAKKAVTKLPVATAPEAVTAQATA
ncbi:H-NS family nucleoid-associated regulatory protein [Paraburkholderia sp. RL17-347-BIC-D]|uniref:H-NS family nucleoid-associated regulatory protein n=1 Tax=Paraburkholderia sp. RL17-347-BIC-D TaxID=3031632 RepID=UPI0038BA0B27